MRTDLTLDNFAVGPANRVAHAAARSVVHASESPMPGAIFYGASGLGKTHLLWGIYNAIAWSDDPRVPFYVSAHQIFQAANPDETLEETTANGFRLAHVLLIDDVQFLAPRPEAQRFLMDIYDEFVRAGRSVVAATDADPRRLSTLHPDLVSRLCSGLVVELHPPDPITRLAILRVKAKQLALCLTDEILSYLADRLVGNVRQIEGALHAILADSRMRGAPPTLGRIQEILHDLGQDSTVAPFDRIERVVCAHLGVPIRRMRSQSRSREVTRARHIVIYLARQLTCYSTEEIGKRLGGRSRAAVRAAEKKMEALVSTDGKLRRLVEELLIALRRSPEGET